MARYEAVYIPLHALDIFGIDVVQVFFIADDDCAGLELAGEIAEVTSKRICADVFGNWHNEVLLPPAELRYFSAQTVEVGVGEFLENPFAPALQVEAGCGVDGQCTRDKPIGREHSGVNGYAVRQAVGHGR